MNLFRTKSIEQMRETAAHSGMAKTLGAFDLILLGIGCVIGTGIFVLTASPPPSTRARPSRSPS